MPYLVSMSINHRLASVDVIEKARFPDVDAALDDVLCLPGMREAIIVQTCNRVEVYGVSDDQDALKKFALSTGMPMDKLCFHSGDGAGEHLMRLACGLESMVVGEDQILGQLKDAYLASEKHGAIGRTLARAVLKAINTGKRARLETAIGRGGVSVGSAAVELAEAVLGSLEGKSILVLGAGDMGMLVARALTEKKLKGIFIANRNYERARSLAESIGGVAVRLDDLPDHVDDADVLICATSAPHYILTRDRLAPMVLRRDGRCLLVIDISNPRNVEPSVGDLEGVEYLSLDDIRQVSDLNLARRLAETAEVERIIAEEYRRLKGEYRRLRADRMIGSLYLRVDEVRSAELARAIARLQSHGGLTEGQAVILEEFSRSLSGKILATPASSLRSAAENGEDAYLQAVKAIFKLNENIEGEYDLSDDKTRTE